MKSLLGQPGVDADIKAKLYDQLMQEYQAMRNNLLNTKMEIEVTEPTTDGQQQATQQQASVKKKRKRKKNKTSPTNQEAVKEEPIWEEWGKTDEDIKETPP